MRDDDPPIVTKGAAALFWRVNLRLDPRLKRVVIASLGSRHAVRRRRVAAEKWAMRDDAPPKVTKGAAAPSFQL